MNSGNERKGEAIWAKRRLCCQKNEILRRTFTVGGSWLLVRVIGNLKRNTTEMRKLRGKKNPHKEKRERGGGLYEFRRLFPRGQDALIYESLVSTGKGGRWGQF